MSDSEKRTLAGLQVRQAMRRQLVVLNLDASIDKAISTLVKFKVNAILLTDSQGRPQGVVSKTDVMSAYYAGLSLESPVNFIMNAPVHYCGETDSLETALEQMRGLGIYRLYVRDAEKQVVGTLAYPDIVGMLYRFCHDCRFSRMAGRLKAHRAAGGGYLKVRDVMNPTVEAVCQNHSLVEVMETLTAHRFGAVLVTDDGMRPAGVISKTDLILAYRHGLNQAATASQIMTSPVRGCLKDQWLEDAIRAMIMSDIHRLFVYQDGREQIEGVLSLSDAARARSGSCQACVTSRINVEK